MPVAAIPATVLASPRGMAAIGVFLLFGAAMASVAGTTLVWPILNPRAHNELAPFERTVGIPFLLLAVALAVAGLGWLKRRRWGWQLAILIIATQMCGDFVNVTRGHVIEGGIGWNHGSIPHRGKDTG